jgi:hypothetical protein
VSTPRDPSHGRAQLARHDSSGRPLEWRTRQELARIAQEEAVTRAAIEAAENQESLAIDQAIINGELLAQHAIGSLGRINRRIADVSRLSPDLEFACREIESVFALAAAQQIGRYMARRRM